MGERTRCIVIKVGSSSLVTEQFALNYERMGQVVRQLCTLAESGYRLVLVTSGAVAAGAGQLRIPRQGMTLPEKQACAAVGQGVLMQAYHELFGSHGLTVAQILLTRDVFDNRARYIHARNTLSALLQYGTIPIVNENDTVAVDEIRFGDNDALSAQVASLLDANLLILLTDTDGIYTSDPRKDEHAVPIRELTGVSEEIVELTGGASSHVGTGGMRSKVTAAQIASQAGIPVVIARTGPDVVLRAVNGEPVGTRIHPIAGRLSGKKRWIAHASVVSGRIMIDGGAVRAVTQGGKSLLASGVVDVDGTFHTGDIVSITTREGFEVGRGVVAYDALEIVHFRGMTTAQIAAERPHQRILEVIHRDNLVTFQDLSQAKG